MSAELLKEQESEIERLRNEISEMKAASEAAKATAALGDAVSTAHKPAPPPTIINQNLQREKCIASVGGVAYWASLPLEQRVAAMGMSPTSAVECEEARKMFSPNSSGLEKSRLMRLNPHKYARLRQLSKIL